MTDPGIAWLDNFVNEDRELARELLNSITFVRLSTMRQRLVEHLHAWAIAHPERLPALVVPALSLEDIDAALVRRQRPRPNRHVAFETFDLDEPISSMPGSEGFVGNLIRDLTSSRTANNTWLKASSGLEELKTVGCRSIVLVTDYSGSGSQMVKFADTFTRNRTIRSWRSGRFLEIHGLAFAASPKAFNVVARSSSIDGFEVTMVAPSFADQPWSDQLRTDIEQLCERGAVRRRDALGFARSRGLFAMETGAPNNLPWILRKDTKDWSPFFVKRNTPASVTAALGEYSPIRDGADLVTYTGQERLANALKTRPLLRRSSTQMLEILAHLRRGRTDRMRLAAALQLEPTFLAKHLKALQELDMIAADLTLTAGGEAELNAGKYAPRRVTFAPPLGEGEYYPRSLR